MSGPISRAGVRHGVAALRGGGERSNQIVTRRLSQALALMALAVAACIALAGGQRAEAVVSGSVPSTEYRVPSGSGSDSVLGTRYSVLDKVEARVLADTEGG